ncbi:hypothetical protein [Desulfurobacterium crinifex]
MCTFPTKDEFIKGIEAYRQYEKRNAMYKVSSCLMKQFWGDAENMANSLGVLLLTWNSPFYRYGQLDFDSLEEFIRNNLDKLNEFREKDITFCSPHNERIVKEIFDSLLEATKISSNGKEKRSPVSVVKALHLLAPNFFPLWDDKISKAYKCTWYKAEKAGEKYLKFMKVMKRFALYVKSLQLPYTEPVLKLIDEYNYSKYTQEWI